MRQFATLRCLTALLAVVMLMSPGTPAAAVGAAKEQVSVTVIPRGNAAGARTFTVALLCETDSEREKGLQGFRPLRADEAALFVFEKPEVVTFWMGTVAYPLDIIFVASNGMVTGVAQDCWPGDTAFFGSGVPVAWVVETASGSGILLGDRVTVHRDRLR